MDGPSPNNHSETQESADTAAANSQDEQTPEPDNESVYVDLTEPTTDNAPSANTSSSPPEASSVQPPQRTIEIIREYKHKPFLGGYRNKHTGVEYHHASTQTLRPPPPEHVLRKLRTQKFHRKTQTVDTISRSQQTTREVGTQMPKPGLYISEANDRVIIPGPYFTSEEHAKWRLDTAIFIQKLLRGWLARRRAARLRAERDARQRELEELAAKKAEDEKRFLQNEQARRLNPKTAKDFKTLRSELAAWKVDETERISAMNLPPEQKKAAMLELLRMETKHLETIMRMKAVAEQEKKQKRVLQNLQQMVAPKVWQDRNAKKPEDGIVHVELPSNTRAKELMALYNALNMPLLSVDERLDVLLHVKWTVKEFDCNLTRDIVELIDREADLLYRERSAKSLEGLRRRLSNLFLQFIETPEFNPEAKMLQRLLPFSNTLPLS